MAETINTSNNATEKPAAGDLVLDILSTHDAPTLTISALVRAGEICGLSAASVRVAVNRLVARGKITSRARGVYALRDGDDSLVREVESWLRTEQRTADWRGDWVGVIDAGVARGAKTAWRRHERALRLRGFRTLADSGLRLRPNNLHGGVARLDTDLRALGLARAAYVIGVNPLLAADQAQAEALWDVAAMRDAYATLLARLDASDARLDRLSLQEGARESLLLGRVVIREIVHDPLLPPALMGSDLRLSLIERMRAYQTRAKALWLKVLDDA